MDRIKIDKTAQELQDQLKKHVVSLIMNENTFLTDVEYIDEDSNKGVNITYITGTVEIV